MESRPCLMNTAMNNAPNRQPLWQALAEAGNPPCSMGEMAAAQILAVRDWLVPEEKQPPQRMDTGGWNSWHDKLCWEERQRLRTLLTAEVERAERGLPHPKNQTF